MFAPNRSETLQNKGFGGLWTENRGAPKTQIQQPRIQRPNLGPLSESICANRPAIRNGHLRAVLVLLSVLGKMVLTISSSVAGPLGLSKGPCSEDSGVATRAGDSCKWRLGSGDSRDSRF